jgi:hypothetical protein
VEWSRFRGQVRARAKAAHGDIQPEKHDDNYSGYVIDHLLPIEVIIASPQ